MRKTYEIVQINESVYHIADVNNVYYTLIKGSQRALLVDTGYGLTDVKATVESLITTPYDVINTHAHPDHILGNTMFPYAYMSQTDIDNLSIAVKSPDSAQKLREFTKMMELSPEEKEHLAAFPSLPLRPVEDHRIFDLGDLHAEVLFLPGHTTGSIGILIQEQRLLLSGDVFSPFLWMFLPDATSISEFEKTLKYGLTLPFDNMLTSHTSLLIPKAFLSLHLKNLQGLDPVTSGKDIVLGCEVNVSSYNEGPYASRILYSLDKL